LFFSCYNQDTDERGKRQGVGRASAFAFNVNKNGARRAMDGAVITAPCLKYTTDTGKNEEN
jgi:hypothetical protein